jgi:hypothetical protein
MSEPACPPNYTCTFTPDPPPRLGPWWEGQAGTIAVVVAVVALTFIVCWCAYYWYEAAKDRRERVAAREDRDFRLAVQEQFTAQIDMAKGDPEMLKIVQEQQRRIR